MWLVAVVAPRWARKMPCVAVSLPFAPCPDIYSDEPFTVATLRGLFSLNTPVNEVDVSTPPFWPIKATTRGTVMVER